MNIPIHFDLSALPANERFDFWHDCGSLVYRPVQLDANQSDELHVQSCIIQLGLVVLGRMQASVQRYERTDTLLKRDHVDAFHLILVEKGEMAWTFSRQSLHAGPGDLLLLDATQASRSDWSEHRVIFAHFPRHLLAPLAGGPSQAFPGVLRAGHPYNKVLSQHLRSLWECQISGTSPTCAGLGGGLATLVKAYFQDWLTHDLGHQCEASREVLQQSMQAWIDQQLHRPDLNAQQIGQAFHLSRSSVYELFKPHGGVKSYIQTQRLERALALLRASDAGHGLISRVAAQLGFSSISSFSRAFRDYWGVSPREARVRAIDELNSAMQLIPPVENSSDWDLLQQDCKRYYQAISRG